MPMHVLWCGFVCFGCNRMRAFGIMVVQMQKGRAAAMAVEMGMPQNGHSSSHRRIERIAGWLRIVAVHIFVIVTMPPMFVLDKFDRPGMWEAIMIDGHGHCEAMGLGNLFDGFPPGATVGHGEHLACPIIPESLDTDRVGCRAGQAESGRHPALKD